MGISQSTLSAKIETELQVVFGGPADSAQLKKFCDAIAKAVVDEIHSNAVVNVTTTTPNAQSGSSVLAGTGVGTIT